MDTRQKCLGMLIQMEGVVVPGTGDHRKVEAGVLIESAKKLAGYVGNKPDIRVECLTLALAIDMLRWGGGAHGYNIEALIADAQEIEKYIEEEKTK